MNLCFEQKLEEFANEPNLEKFNNYKSNISFNDNTRMYSWFIWNKDKVLSSTDDLSLKIQKQYEEYLNNKKRLSKDEKIQEFIAEPNFKKFSQYEYSINFSDNTIMGTWFNSNKRIILNSTDELSLKIQKQYEEYLNNTKRLSKDEKIQEFIAEPNFKKFSKCEFFIKFSDNAHMGIWFNKNKKIILSSTDELSLKIQKQYEEYLNNTKRLSKDEKIQEFIAEPNLNKFNQSNWSIKFSDNTIIGIWFSKNKKIILSSTDELSLKIQKQYEEYINNIKRLGKDEKIQEFIAEPDLNKFNQSNCSIKFSDDVNMGKWFYNNKRIILNSTNELSLRIQKQYEECINNMKRLGKDEKIQEFIAEPNLNKFNQSNCSIKFSDDVNMGKWFNNNRKTLLLDDCFVLSIIKQYKNCTKKMDIKINYTDVKNFCWN